MPSTSTFNVKVESQKIKKIKLLKKWEAPLSNNARYCLTREKTFVATSESPVTEWPIAIAHLALGELAPNPQISRLQSHRLPHRLSLVTGQRFDSFGMAIAIVASNQL
jgi:hypothetical protein